MIRLTRLAPVIVVAATVAGTACRRQPAPEPAPTPTVNQDSIDAAARARADSIARADAARRDSLARAEAERAAAARAAEARNALTAAVYFDFDSEALSDQARATLDSKLAVLNANTSVRIRISGHADERGSDEYNLALGQRRAASAKRYLTERGIAADRIEVTSFGEERPAVEGHDESAWSQNRRDEFEITAGGEQIAAPAQ
ncbi:MAG TPA: peptidoglycan-associated lipoprotein Pal [Gemmatimonadaceae bacterium]|nr:peptidoglycan-associated lipoprotein Pal [Gemmatimonadaceae bacterium]